MQLHVLELAHNWNALLVCRLWAALVQRANKRRMLVHAPYSVSLWAGGDLLYFYKQLDALAVFSNGLFFTDSLSFVSRPDMVVAAPQNPKDFGEGFTIIARGKRYSLTRKGHRFTLRRAKWRKRYGPGQSLKVITHTLKNRPSASKLWNMLLHMRGQIHNIRKIL